MAVGDLEYKGDSGTVYLMNFGTNALCRLEEQTGQYHADVIERLSQPKAPVDLARVWLWASLVDRTNLTIEKAGDILDDIGGPYAIVLAFQEVRKTREEVAA